MFKMNKVLLYAYLAHWTASLSFGFFLPFVAVFILQQIAGGSAEIIGYATGIHMIIRFCSEFPGGIFLDEACKKNPKRTFYFFSAHMFANSALIFSFLFITFPWQLYLVQILRGLISGFTIPSIMVVFSRYLNRDHAGKEWGMLGGMTGLLYGIGSPVGGILITRFGFQFLFIFAGVIHFIAALISLLMLKINRSTRPTNRVGRKFSTKLSVSSSRICKQPFTSSSLPIIKTPDSDLQSFGRFF